MALSLCLIQAHLALLSLEILLSGVFLFGWGGVWGSCPYDPDLKRELQDRPLFYLRMEGIRTRLCLLRASAPSCSSETMLPTN